MAGSPLKRLAAFLMAASLVALGTHPQAQTSAPRFEVATIRLASDCSGAHEQESPGRFGILCVHLRDVIRVAFGNVEGLPQGDFPR